MLQALTRSLLLTSLMAIPTMAQETSTSPTLSQQLAEKAAGFAKRAPADRLATFTKGIADVRKSGIEESAKQVGDEAVDGTLKGWKGDSVTLSKLWSEGPVVLMWYRGGWCPYCNIQLRAMQQSLDELENAGARLVVLTPELPETAKQTAEATEEISATAATIEDQTNSAGKAMSSITETIQVIHDIQTTIASAVEQQTATTSEIANSVGEAATGAGEIAERIAEIAAAIQQTTEASNASKEATDTLSALAAELKRIVGRFTY